MSGGAVALDAGRVPVGGGGRLVHGGYDDRIALRRLHLLIAPAQLEESGR